MLASVCASASAALQQDMHNNNDVSNPLLKGFPAHDHAGYEQDNFCLRAADLVGLLIRQF